MAYPKQPFWPFASDNGSWVDFLVSTEVFGDRDFGMGVMVVLPITHMRQFLFFCLQCLYLGLPGVFANMAPVIARGHFGSVKHSH